jgi:hypothetical protein
MEVLTAAATAAYCEAKTVAVAAAQEAVSAANFTG